MDPLIFGRNKEPGLVAVEHLPSRKGAADEVALFHRQGATVQCTREPFTAFLWIERPELLTGAPSEPEIQTLEGRNPLKALALFKTMKEFDRCVAWLKKKTGFTPSDPRAPYFLLNDPVQQHLLLTGRTLFKGMKLRDLRRLQVDIETACAPEFEFSNAERESDRILCIALADESGWVEVLTGDEKAMLEKFVRLVKEKDPDCIEGHNLFKFDLPYLQTRCGLHGVKFAPGRDGSAPRTHASRFVIADRTLAYPRAEIYGRHVIDTYFLAMAYDVSHRSLEGFGLKEVAAHFGLSAPNRTYVDGDEIARTYESDPETIHRYARDDIVETRAISDLLSPSFFVQAQILPFSYQNICVRGSGTKIDSLLLREYLHQKRSVPLPDPPREFAGGYTDIFETGVIGNVHHCDVRSLYPSIMMKDELQPKSDEIGVFLKLLGYLRDFRIQTKQQMQKSVAEEERNYLDALQSTFKILINSFYGYMGFSQARFGDFEAAERVAEEGRALLRRMIDWIRAHGGRPIEIDTDGIYFVPPDVENEEKMTRFQKEFQESLPEGIEVEFDGRYRAMLSYKMKNYAVLDENGEIIIKGAALKSRGLEPFQRAFVREWLRLALEGKSGETPALVATYRKAIAGRAWPIRMLAKTETLQDAPATYQGKVSGGDRGRNAAYELALRSNREYRAGDQISYYVCGDKKGVAVHSSAKLVSEWDPERRDENVAYYLAKLDALAQKFDAMIHRPKDNELELDFGPGTKEET